MVATKGVLLNPQRHRNQDYKKGGREGCSEVAMSPPSTPWQDEIVNSCKINHSNVLFLTLLRDQKLTLIENICSIQHARLLIIKTHTHYILYYLMFSTICVLTEDRFGPEAPITTLEH